MCYVIYTCKEIYLILVGIDPPNNVKITVLAPKIIEVDWDPIISEEVTGYLIIYSTLAPYARGSNITVYGYNISKTMLKNLEENTLYSVTVRSIAQNKLSGFSNMVKAITWASGKCTENYMCSYIYMHFFIVKDHLMFSVFSQECRKYASGKG